MRRRLKIACDKVLGLEEHRGALDDAIKETNAILETFAALLGIAQVESRARRERFTDLDLSEIAGSVIDAYETVAEDHGQNLEVHIESDVRIRGDKDLLTQLLTNFVENAIRHCATGTRIVLSLNKDTGRPRLDIADTPALAFPRKKGQMVLDRFYRVEQSITTPGSGLGLAPVTAVADLHDASLELATISPA